MGEQHFSLLRVRPGEELEFSGPLAHVLAKRLKDNKMVKTIASLSRLKKSGEIELLGMRAKVTEDGTFSASATGPWENYRMPEKR